MVPIKKGNWETPRRFVEVKGKPQRSDATKSSRIASTMECRSRASLLKIMERCKVIFPRSTGFPTFHLMPYLHVRARSFAKSAIKFRDSPNIYSFRKPLALWSKPIINKKRACTHALTLKILIQSRRPVFFRFSIFSTTPCKLLSIRIKRSDTDASNLSSRIPRNGSFINYTFHCGRAETLSW